MTIETGLDPVSALAIVGVLGVGAQWVAWRMQIPAIVLMLAAGIIAGPVSGILDPMRDLGTLMGPLISIAVALILFEGGLTLSRQSLSGAATGVYRLVLIGAPVGWLLSTLALHYVAGLGWASATVFGGIMIVTGPTVIAPLLRQAKLAKRPAALLQWEAIVNDPIGALAAVLAFEYVMVVNMATSFEHAMVSLVMGCLLALCLGLAGGYGLSTSFRRGWVPEYMKVPVLVIVIIAIFAGSNAVLYDSGLLAVTVMGIWMANADLPSYQEIRRFKEHATVLLVSGVFILLAASVDLSQLAALDLWAVLLVACVILLVRPTTVLVSLFGSSIPWRERVLVAFTGPRGVVLVAVAGLFGVRLSEIGVADADQIAPLAFALVMATVVLHGFSLKPFASALGLAGGAKPGVLIVGANAWGTSLADALHRADVPVLLADRNMRNLRAARDLGVPTYFGDILSETAEHHLDVHHYQFLLAVTDNDAYNTLVTTDWGPEFGRANVFQTARDKESWSRYALPASLGGRIVAQGRGYGELQDKIRDGWTCRVTSLSVNYTYEQFCADRPEAMILGAISENGRVRFFVGDDNGKVTAGVKLLHFSKPREKAVVS